MHTVVGDFSWKKASSVEQAVAALSDEPGLRPFAGGTDLMVEVEAGILQSASFLDINDLQELRYVRDEGALIESGALSTYTDFMTNPLITENFPMLVRAAEETAAPAIQNRGTVGGNIANASPAADTPPALLCYDAEIVLRSKAGTRVVPYDTFHKGYKKFDKHEDELIVAVRLAKQDKRCTHWYTKVGTRRMQAISKVVFAGLLFQEQGVIKKARLAYGSVAAVPIRAIDAENYLQNKTLQDIDHKELCRHLEVSVTPIDDVRSTAEYRKAVARNIVLEFLRRAEVN
jgi:CO/xanthine dehydrogenase FAD-binding subunit